MENIIKSEKAIVKKVNYTKGDSEVDQIILEFV